MVKSVAYILRSFPEPSETFIAEEAASLAAFGIRISVFHLLNGDRTTTHPTTQMLLDRAHIRQIRPISVPAMFVFLLRWLLVAPIRTLLTLLASLKHPARWCYFQALAPAWWCRQHKVDFMHAHFADTNLQYAAAISAWSGVPFGVTTHGYDLRENPLGVNQASYLFRQANLVVTVSDYNRNHMSRTFGLPTRDIAVVHCGIDLDRFSCVQHPPLLPGQPLHLLNVGRLVPEKGQDVLLHALAQTRDRGICFRLDIIGGGPLLESLMALAQQLEIADLVHFHGAQPEAVVRRMHAEAHVFVLPSRSEGLPVACMEALALCSPTIATRITGVPELIEDGVSGLLVESEDPIALADAISRIYDNPALLDRLADAGRRSVINGFDRRECTHELIDLWNNAVKKPGPVDAPNR